MTIISAMTADRVIGAGDGMPWDVPEEYQHYLNTVRGHAVVFGRKSYEIFGKDLEASRRFVVTRRPSVDGDARVASSLTEALEIAGAEGGEVFVAGGASIYEAAIPLAERMLLSTIHGDYAGDTFFPAFDELEWRVASKEEHDRYTLREWRRRANPDSPDQA